MIAEVSKKAPSADNPWEDLVVSMLSVNNWSLEKTYYFLDNLRAQGLFDPNRLGSLDQDEIVTRLRKAGYDRGTFMNNLFALRLGCLGQSVKRQGILECTNRLSGNVRPDIEVFLASVKGIGPVVIANFFFLRGIP